jgi:hypothetical protein
MYPSQILVQLDDSIKIKQFVLDLNIQYVVRFHVAVLELPNSFDAVLVEHRFVADDGHRFNSRLINEHPIERVAMMKPLVAVLHAYERNESAELQSHSLQYTP